MLAPRSLGRFSRLCAFHNLSRLSVHNLSRLSVVSRFFSTSAPVYSKLLDDLLTINMNRMVKMGITNTLRLCSVLGEGWAGEGFRTVHVAGTNGKGSVTVKIASVLQAHGFKVGVFTSPHISSFRERIVVNGEYISEEAICQILPELLAATRKHQIEATFFELTTLLGLRHFALSGVDFAVIEVGLGGRLDSTNVILPEVSVITSISLDHVSILGDTIEKIAVEKCGIIKPGVPVVIGPRTPAHVSMPIAKNLGCRHVQVEGKFEDFDEENSKIAEIAVEELWKTMDGEVFLDREKMQRALKARPPCRFQHFKYISPSSVDNHEGQTIDVVLDVGHNEDGLQHLFTLLKKRFPTRTARVVFGLAKEKDATSVMKLFRSFEQIKSVHLVQANSPRAAQIEDMTRLASEHFGPGIVIEESLDPSVGTGIRTAIKGASQSNGQEVLVVCGSFFVMKEARAALDIPQPLDPFDLNERFSPTSGKAIGTDTGPTIFNP